MVTRTDIDMTFTTSPRAIEVQNTSVQMLMQDLVDTLRIQEESFRGMTEKRLTAASGKEDLGDSVSVGITVAMQNTLLAFAGRTTPAETGTVTGSPASPVFGRQIMQDSAADFVTAGIARGSFLVNFTDQSVADVVSVDNATQITTKTLIEGIGNTYDVTDVYKIWNIIQCDASGGNLTAVDGLQATISAILPTAFTQVVVKGSSSATLINGDISNQLVENGLTMQDVLSIILAASAGKADGGNTTLMNYRNQADTKNRITATVDEFGNRTSITIDLTN